MRSWRTWGAALVATGSVLLNGQVAAAATVTTPIAEDAQECLRSAPQMAADDYRVRRRQILQAYRTATQRDQELLRQGLDDALTSSGRDAAWQRYKDSTAAARATALTGIREARTAFRVGVLRARWQLGLDRAM